MRFQIPMLAVLLAACAPQNGEAVNGTPPRAQEDRAVGTVAVVGSAPMNVAVVIRDGRGDVRVEGPLREEIRTLAGAVVEVRGRMADRALQASGYEIRSVNGRPVETGTVERGASGGLQLRRSDGSTVALSGGGSNLRAGQKVWVQGPASVVVQSYGVITP
jgi:hypothetical protein